MLLAQSRHETALGKEWMSVKISQLHLSDFMLFQQADFQWSPGINVICGTNSTGKTALIKLMYSLHKSYEQWNSTETKEAAVNRFSEKLCGVFRPDNGKVGRLVRRKQGNAQMTASMGYENGTSIDVNFGNRASKIATLILPKMEHTASPDHTAVYFPPKEIISATENFTSLYEEYHIAFEETYYDLAKLLDRPLKRGKNSDEQNNAATAVRRDGFGTMSFQMVLLHAPSLLVAQPSRTFLPYELPPVAVSILRQEASCCCPHYAGQFIVFPLFLFFLCALHFAHFLFFCSSSLYFFLK